MNAGQEIKKRKKKNFVKVFFSFIEGIGESAQSLIAVYIVWPIPMQSCDVCVLDY